MTDNTALDHSDDQIPFLDVLLREALPEIKLALGELIDRENSRSLPSKYARLLPETHLLVTLRPDAAEALAPVAATVERELTDSCTRHGSLYDRAYRVQLRRTEDPGAPLYRVSAHAGHAGAGDDAQAQPEADVGSGPHVQLPAVRADREKQPAAPLPIADPDATRIADVGPPGWQAGRWLLLVENEAGEQMEVFRLTDSFVTVGRQSADPQLRTTIAISDAPHVSRRQLALVWDERDGAPGFRLFNLGLNPVHLPGQEIPGAHVGKGPLQLESVAKDSTGWLPPGIPLRIGDHGPVLRIEEVPAGEDEEEADAPRDPDATVFE